MDINSYASINALLVSTLKDILPVAHDEYSGDATTYGIFTTYNRLPEQFASGKNHSVGLYGDLDVFSGTDLSGASSIIGTITAAMNGAGFTVLDPRDAPFDGVSHHSVIEFYFSKSR